MGKDWDAPWKYTISEHGFTDGGNRLPAPSFTSSRNPTCQNCGRRQRTWKGGPPACSCGQDWKYGFSEGGWKGKNYPETPTFESARNPVCQKCHLMKRGSVRHEQCECPEPAFDDVAHRIQDRQKFQAWCVAWLQECYRVLTPGGIIKVFGATRMFHRMAAAMEEAGFVLQSEHSLEAWAYGSGFPKSLNVSKSIDQHLGKKDERPVVGSGSAGSAFHYGNPGEGGFGTLADKSGGTPSSQWEVTTAATSEAARFEGWGTALKPGWEPFIVGVKPSQDPQP